MNNDTSVDNGYIVERKKQSNVLNFFDNINQKSQVILLK